MLKHASSIFSFPLDACVVAVAVTVAIIVSVATMIVTETATCFHTIYKMTNRNL